jgi:hypothetical protein
MDSVHGHTVWSMTAEGGKAVQHLWPIILAINNSPAPEVEVEV